MIETMSAPVSEPTSSPLRPRVRAVRHDFSQARRYWYADNPVISHLANGVNLLFPAGERFFIRSVKRFAHQVEDPQLQEDIRAFYGQEGAHTREHERFIAVIREQGYDVDEFLAEFDAVLRRVESTMPEVVSLATTAATEHFTALLAVSAWHRRRMMRKADPELRRLFLWHAAEEVEHAHVAFEVFEKAMEGHPLRYPTRVFGLVFATFFLGFWWTRATKMLHRQDGRSRAEFQAELAKLEDLMDETGTPKESLLRDIFLRGILLYARPGFHPRDLETGEAWGQAELARRLLEEADSDPAELTAREREAAA